MSTDWKDMLAGLNVSEGSDDGNNGTNAPVKAEAKRVTLFYEVKGRGGKPATILADFGGVSDEEIVLLASELKRRLGTGGSCRGNEILVQGDKRDMLRKILSDKGFHVKG